MRRLVYRPAALADLDAIFDYIALRNPGRAVSFVDELKDQCAKLSALPGMLGRSRQGLCRDLRSFVYRGYLIFFRYASDRLEIVHVIEGHRDMDAYFASVPDED